MLTTTLLAAGAGIAGWIAANFVATPIQSVRRARLNAISVGEMYALTPLPISKQDEEDVRAAKRALVQAAVELRTHLRGQSWVVRAFCRLLRYDLEDAVIALGNLEGLAGLPYDNASRRMLLNFLYLSLNAHKMHMTKEQVAELRRIVAEDKAAIDAPNQEEK